jgi:AcrR family transcriptional regulator
MSGVQEERPQRDGEATRQRLIEAAIELFAKQGFAGASIRDLASAAGVSLAGLYHHFTSKDEILFEIQREAFGRLIAPLEDIPLDTPPEERLELFIRNHLRFFTHHMTEMKVLSHELEALRGELGKEIAHMRGRYYRFCLEIAKELLEKANREDLNPRVATMALFGTINWIYRWYEPDRERTASDLTRQIITIFLRGVLGPAHTPAHHASPPAHQG